MTETAFAQLPSGPLILASTSATRKRLLANAGIAFTTQAVHIDEDAIRRAAAAEEMVPADVAVLLAEMKGQAAQMSAVPTSGQLLLAADQILDFDGQMLGKPTDRDMAETQLRQLSGEVHKLQTAAVVFRDGQRIWHHVAETRLHVRKLSDADITSYLDIIGDAAFWSPGSYQIEGAGMHLFHRIEGCHYSILGLPLLQLTAFLREHGLALHGSGTSRDGQPESSSGNAGRTG